MLNRLKSVVTNIQCPQLQRINILDIREQIKIKRAKIKKGQKIKKVKYEDQPLKI